MPFRPALPMNRANLRCLGLSVGIAIALCGCSPHGRVILGEADNTDYQMADQLAPDDTRSGALARQGLADGYLSASEAAAMWDAFRAEKRVRDSAERSAIIKRWQRPASGIAAPSGGETAKTGSTEGKSPTVEDGDAQGPSAWPPSIIPKLSR